MNTLGGSWSEGTSEGRADGLPDAVAERSSAFASALAGATPRDFADMAQALTCMTQLRPVRRRSMVQFINCAQTKRAESVVSWRPVACRTCPHVRCGGSW